MCYLNYTGKKSGAGKLNVVNTTSNILYISFVTSYLASLCNTPCVYVCVYIYIYNPHFRRVIFFG
jgi:hypothetical protein